MKSLASEPQYLLQTQDDLVLHAYYSKEILLFDLELNSYKDVKLFKIAVIAGVVRYIPALKNEL